MPQEFSLIPNGATADATSQRGTLSGSLRQYKGLVALALAAALLWGVQFGLGFWEGWARSATSTAVQQQDAIIAELEQSDLEGAKDFAAQVRGVQRILKNHIAPSQLMGPFEESIHDQVVVTSFDLDVVTRQLRVAASAPSLDVMGQQFVLWRDDAPFVESATLEQFSTTSENRVIFSVLIVVKEGLVREDIERTL